MEKAMTKTAVMTDTNSGMTLKEAKELSVFLLPMPFFVNGEQFLEGVTLSREEYFTAMRENAEVSTSQPSPIELIEMWETIFSEGYDELVYIPMSSGLSASCDTANVTALDYEGKIQIVDNHRISVTQIQSVYNALDMVKQGKTALEIKEALEKSAYQASIYISVDTLYYLKKGGRITAAAAAFGTVLNIKPVLSIQGDKLDAFAKVRGMKAARKTMLDAIEKDIETRFAQMYEQGKMRVCISYSNVEDEILQSWIEEVKARFPGEKIQIDPLSLSVCCHIGEGALAVAICNTVEE